MNETPLHIWLVCALLLGASGCFSASETALFSLSQDEIGRAGRPARRMLERPRDLLITILLGNLLVNLLFFAFAARIRVPGTEHGELVAGAGALVAILLAGEILPKTLALRAPLVVARALALPLTTLVSITGPLRRAIRSLLELIHRAIGEAAPQERGITTDQLARVLAKSADEGLLEGSEANLLSEIVELGGIRVREIMTPRVDALILDLTEDIEPVLREALRRHDTWLPVTDGGKDRVVGCVRVRDLLLDDDRPLRQVVMPVKFVPEVADALDLLLQFREDRTAEAVVVDEWGGTAGIVTIEDVFEEIVGELRVEGEEREKPVVPLGEKRFRVAGNLSVRDWNEEFGRQVVPTEFETVAGFVTALLGRIPRTGDRVRVGDLVCEVREVRGRRVLSVDMYVDEARGGAG